LTSSPFSEKNRHLGNVEEEEKIELLNNPEDVIKLVLRLSPKVRNSLDGCFDYTGPSIQVETKPVWNEIINLYKRGVRLRFITEVTSKNIHYCKEMLKYVEVRHLEAVKGNFGIQDGQHYLGHIIQKEGEPPRQLFHVSIKGFVKQQQYLFDNLWSKAVPAEYRIKEIEEGIIPDLIEILKQPSEIINLGHKLVRAARDEILLIFHTANGLLRQDRAGGIGLLIENVGKYETRVKILVPIEDKILATIQRLKKINGIQIRNIEPAMQTRMTILVVDRMFSLVVELKDDSKENSEEAIGLATYSNSKSTVLSYASIFDTLWKQSELREELLNRNVAQKEFINIAAHELRNPIQPILGLSDILQHSDTFLESNTKDKAKQEKEMIDIIARNARRLQHLTEDILDITRIEGKTLKLNKESFILPEIIRELVLDYSTEIKSSAKNITLSISSSKELESIPIIADKNRIKQVICNLIDNAIKFIQKGEIYIATEIDNKNDQVIVKVKDTGMGIDSDMLPRLFAKFVTKSESGGTGLGLYICKGIIEAHQGMIWAENNSEGNHSMEVDRGDRNMRFGMGTTFSFCLPLTRS
jgi:two-component system, OmpR family, sensor histidine kinase VicK